MNYLKKGVVLFLFFGVVIMTNAQIGNDPIKNFMVEKKAIYKGCEDSEDANKCFSKILYQKLKIFDPEAVEILKSKYGTRLRAQIVFIVNKNGEIKVKKIVNKEEDIKEFVSRFITSLGKFEKAGFEKGKAVNVEYTIPVSISR